MKRKIVDLEDIDLRKLDLTRKYDEVLDPYETLSWRDHILLYAVAAFFFLFIVWASLATVDEVTRGMGQVIPSSEIQVVQNLEGGIIDEILVREGETVQAGQVIVRMRNVEASSDFRSNQKRYLGAKAMLARLKAEAEGAAPSFPEDVMKDAPESVETEMAAYKANLAQYEDQLSILQQQMQQRQQEVRELEQRIGGVRDVLKLSREQQSMIAPLVQRGSASRMELLEIDSKVKEQETELSNLELSLPRARSSVGEVQSRIQEHKSNRRAKAQQQMAEKMTEMNTVGEKLTAFQDVKERTEVKAPVYGTVKDIKVKTVGGVVRPGEDIMEIVPLDDALVVEANVSPADIAFVYPGQAATVKITAYDYSIYGGLKAKVIDISADTIKNDKGESFYRVRLQSDDAALRHKGENLPILPGMMASVDILTGEKTVMAYLLKPFRKTLDNALHER